MENVRIGQYYKVVKTPRVFSVLKEGMIVYTVFLGRFGIRLPNQTIMRYNPAHFSKLIADGVVIPYENEEKL
jgi:predicted ATP-dependent Lon-type protease